MIVDLDHRLAGLQAQRAALLTGLPVHEAPAGAGQSLPTLDALPAPVPAAPPPTFTHTLQARDLAALEEHETHSWQRQVVREQRSWADDYQHQKEQRLGELAIHTAERQYAIHEKYRLPLATGEMRKSLLEPQLETAKSQMSEAASQANLAQLQLDEASSKAGPHREGTPESRTIRDLRATDAQYQQRLQATNARYQAIKTALDTVNTTYTDEEHHYKTELKQLDTDQDVQAKAIEITLAKAAEAQRTQVEKRLKDAATATIARERARLSEVAIIPEDERRNAVAFAPQPAATLTLATAGLPRTFDRAAAGRRQDRETALREIDQKMADVRQQRDDLVHYIVQDTRAAAQAVATEHGYRIDFTPRCGQKNLTRQLRGWLQAYWPPTRK